MTKSTGKHLGKFATIKQKIEKRAIRSDDGCLVWSGSRDDCGYGTASLNGKTVKVHRAAWIDANGDIGHGIEVCHLCDNPSCVDVDHMFLGTRRQNMIDASMKSRWSNGVTNEIAMEMRKMHLDGNKIGSIAAKFGVSYKYAWAIATGRTRRYATFGVG